MLNVDVCGNGPDLVLLHGWGMHSAVMTPWAQELTGCFRISAVDLPGHGNSSWAGLTELGDWVDAVLDVVPRDAWWLGWSLGGLVALEAMQRKRGQLKGAVCMASTPKFVTAPDWPMAVDGEVFDEFAQQLHQDTGRTLLRFLSLQVRGASGGARTLRQLRTALNTRPLADSQALLSGLGFLKDCDRRPMLADAKQKLFWILGERDTLVPEQLSTILVPKRTRVVRGAGHAPFLSHPQQCSEQVKRWLLGTHECSEYGSD